jgi:urease accessory protein
MTSSPLALARLLQITSPLLPVGAYTYSQGLEWAVESGRIKDEASARAWIGGLLENAIGRFEAPLVAQLMRHWRAGNAAEIARLNADFLGSRETAELHAETLQMGFSLVRLLADFADEKLATLRRMLDALPQVAFPTAWSGLAAHWEIDEERAVAGYLWSWTENQVTAAMKAVPLGQAAGQRLLAELGGRVPAVVQSAMVLPEDAWYNFMPTFAICSARHETQYSRLFRS